MKDIIEYWFATADHDRETMEVLFKNGRYSDALFFGHILLEKALKGLVVQNTGEHAPYVHNLLQLQELSGIIFMNEEKDLMDEINDFNIRARYPEYRLEFYKKSNKEFTETYMIKINQLYKKLCSERK